MSKQEFQKVTCQELCEIKLPAPLSKKTCSKDIYCSSRIGCHASEVVFDS